MSPSIRVRKPTPAGAISSSRRGNTLRRPACVHWVNDPLGWLTRERDAGTAVVGVEIPMVGIGASLNVAVAGSLVLYRLAELL